METLSVVSSVTVGNDEHLVSCKATTIASPREEEPLIAPTSDVDQRAHVADSAKVWDLAQVRENATVGENTIIGRGAYIDTGVSVGDNCKIQNHALLYAPAVIEDGVFIGPAVVFTNDAFPRAINSDGSLKNSEDWEMTGVTVRQGASIGARAVILGGVAVGEWALVAAGAVVTSDVPSHALMVGVPARRIGWVGVNGHPLDNQEGLWVDPEGSAQYREVGERLVPA